MEQSIAAQDSPQHPTCERVYERSRAKLMAPPRAVRTLLGRHLELCQSSAGDTTRICVRSVLGRPRHGSHPSPPLPLTSARWPCTSDLSSLTVHPPPPALTCYRPRAVVERSASFAHKANSKSASGTSCMSKPLLNPFSPSTTSARASMSPLNRKCRWA